MHAIRFRVVTFALLLLPLGVVEGIEPVNKRKPAANEITAPQRNWSIGVEVRKLDTGVEIVEVQRETPASRARLEPRDVIVTVNGQQVGIVAGREVDLLDALAIQADASGRVLLLVQNHRDRSLINVPMQATYHGPERRGVVTRKPVVNVPDVEVNPNLKAVDSFYQKYLGRPASREELAKWDTHLKRGGHLQDVQVAILSCDEFYERSGGNLRSFIGNLYQNVLGRPANAREAVRWEQRLPTQFKGSRSQLVKVFFVLEVNNGREYP